MPQKNKQAVTTTAKQTQSKQMRKTKMKQHILIKVDKKSQGPCLWRGTNNNIEKTKSKKGI
jgi:hypothetical protein